MAFIKKNHLVYESISNTTLKLVGFEEEYLSQISDAIRIPAYIKFGGKDYLIKEITSWYKFSAFATNTEYWQIRQLILPEKFQCIEIPNTIKYGYRSQLEVGFLETITLAGKNIRINVYDANNMSYRMKVAFPEQRINSIIEDILSDIEKKKTKDSYSYTTSKVDKRYKTGEKTTSHYVSAQYAERTISERKSYINSLITSLSEDKNLSIDNGLAYLYCFVFINNFSLRRKGLKTVKNRIFRNFGDIQSKQEELKYFKKEYKSIVLSGWILRLLIRIFFAKSDSLYQRIYKTMNGK